MTGRPYLERCIVLHFMGYTYYVVLLYDDFQQKKFKKDS